jgi:purine-binding chemotaxis protein CheW
MAQALAKQGSREIEATAGGPASDFVTFYVRDQLFGIPVLRVQDILEPDRIARIPLAPPEVRGSINLRGRIVTVIDVRTRLGIRAAESAKSMGVTVEYTGELYTLLVDKVGDVIGMDANSYEANPATLDPLWREFADGVHRLKGKLMVVLDIDRLLDIDGNSRGGRS